MCGVVIHCFGLLGWNLEGERERGERGRTRRERGYDLRGEVENGLQRSQFYL